MSPPDVAPHPLTSAMSSNGWFSEIGRVAWELKEEGFSGFGPFLALLCYINYV